MHVSRRGSQALALGAGVAALFALVTPAGFATSTAVPAVTFVESGPASVVAGAPVIYSLTATNTGATATDPVVITDTLPAGFFVTTATFGSPSVPCVVTGVAATGQTVTCGGPVGVVIPLGGSLTASITAVPSVAGTFANAATLTAPGNGIPNSLTSNSVPTTVTGTLTCFGAAPTILSDDAVIDGTAGDDVIMGLGGNNTIDGGAGNDKICGGGGNDHLYGGSGNDSLAGGEGSDVVDGGAGSNTLRGDSDTTQQGPWPGGRHNRRHGRDGRNGHDTLICQHQLDTCDGGFGGNGGNRGNRGNRDDRIIFVGGDDHNGGRNGHHHGYHDFAATKPGTPAKPGVKPAAKPIVKPAAKPAPAVAGTAPVAPKA
jgi:uncharacterized repeat protein (TIGR01451 family)